MNRHDRGAGAARARRRDALRLLAGSGLAALMPSQAALGGDAGPAARGLACVVRPAQTEGPFFVDPALQRSDVRIDPSTGTASPGAALLLAFRVSRMAQGRCDPWPGAYVDVWQCDASGAYSGVSDRGGNLRGRAFLRGYQVTDPEGVARFTTIYPGWYPGRAVHIHFKIRSAPDRGRRFEFTSQVYFDDRLTDRIHAEPPYRARGTRRTRNQDDGIFQDGGEALVLAVGERGAELFAEFPIALEI